MMNRYFTGRSSLSRRMPAAGLGLTATPPSFNIAVTESFVCSSARFKSSQFPGPHRNPSPGRNSDNNNSKRRRDLSSRHNNQRQGHHHHERKYSSSKSQQQQARSERSNKSRQSEGKKEETTYVVVYRDGTFKTSKDWDEAKPWTIGQANKNKGFKNPTQEEIDSFIKRSVGLFRTEAKTPTAASSSSSINDEAASQMEMMMDEGAAEDHHQSQKREDREGSIPDFPAGSGIETNLRGENSKTSTSSKDEKASSLSKRDKRRETTSSSSAKKSEEYASDPLLGELDNLVEDLSSMNTSSPIDEQDETPNRRDKTSVRASSDTGEESTRASNNGKWKIVEVSEEEEPVEAVASQIQETTRSSSEALPSSSAPKQQESPTPTEQEKDTQEAGNKTAETQAEVQKKPSPKKDSDDAKGKHREKTSRDDQRVGESKNKLQDDTGGSKSTEVKKDNRNEDSDMTKAEDVKDLPQARSAIEDAKVRVQKLRTAIEEETRDVEQLKQQQKDKLRPIHTRPTTVAKVPEGVTSSSSTLPLSRTESLENLQLFHPLTKEAASEMMLLSPDKKDHEDDERTSSLDPKVVSRVAHLAKLSLIGELIDLPSFGSEKKEDGEIISPEKKGIEEVRTIPSFVDLSVQMQEEVYKVRCEGLSLVNFCLSSLRPGDLLHIVGDLIVKGGEPTVQVKEAGGTLTLVYGPADEDPESIESDKSESNDTSN